MRNTNHDITSRLAEEIFRTGLTNTELSRRLDCDPCTVSYWITGRSVPRADYLARLYEQGCDVIYILTGRRTQV